jgi:hypothetical protein
MGDKTAAEEKVVNISFFGKLKKATGAIRLLFLMARSIMVLRRKTGRPTLRSR